MQKSQEKLRSAIINVKALFGRSAETVEVNLAALQKVSYQNERVKIGYKGILKRSRYSK